MITARFFAYYFSVDNWVPLNWVYWLYSMNVYGLYKLIFFKYWTWSLLSVRLYCHTDPPPKKLDHLTSWSPLVGEINKIYTFLEFFSYFKFFRAMNPNNPILSLRKLSSFFFIFRGLLVSFSGSCHPRAPTIHYWFRLSRQISPNDNLTILGMKIIGNIFKVDCYNNLYFDCYNVSGRFEARNQFSKEPPKIILKLL